MEMGPPAPSGLILPLQPIMHTIRDEGGSGPTAIQG